MVREEALRRLRLGDLRRYCRHRHGHTLPDDDAGREDLHELLLAISLGTDAARKMCKAIEIFAPWMRPEEAGQLLDHINRTPGHLRKPTARKLGERLNLQNWEREQLGIRTIAAVDLTDEQLKDRRRVKKRARDRRRRRAAGSKPREVYLANSLSRQKPWEIEGISRATWYRHQQRSETGPRQEHGDAVRQVRAK